MKSMRKTIALIMCVLTVAAFSPVLCAFAQDAATTTAVAEEATTADALGGIMEYFDGIDLGIDGYGIVSSVGKFFDSILAFLNRLLEYIAEAFTGVNLLPSSIG